MDKLGIGSLDLEYAKGRETKKSLRNRLWRRTSEVLSAIKQFTKSPLRNIIDLGTADARMLDSIHRRYPQAHCIGVECVQELVDFAKSKFPHLEIIKGDVESLDFPDSSFDLGIATSVIEHVSSPAKMLHEAKRILKPGGILILTSPDPFWERLATLVGHLKKEQHQTVMNIKQLCNLTKECGFTVLKTQKFMLSPFAMPFEAALEKIIRKSRLDFLMANQLLVVRC